MEKYPYKYKIICGEWDYKEIGHSWCCDLNKKEAGNCDDGCEKCFKDHGVEFEIEEQEP